jgi:hypothetical protein
MEKNTMSLKLVYYGQNDSQFSPDQILTGDPGTDQQTLTAAGYLGGKVLTLGTPVNNTAVTVALSPCDGDTKVPFGTLMNGPGEFAGAIGPSGSKKVPVVRAFWQGNINSEAYDAAATFTLGGYVYVGGTTHTNIGLYTSAALKGTLSGAPAIGICTHVPTASEPWLGVASLI